MPSRVIHDIIGHILETSDVHQIDRPVPTAMFGENSFYQQYMQQPQEALTLRKTLRESELYDLPVNVYQELLDALQSWHTTRESLNFGTFRDVRLVYIERRMSPESYGMDFLLEFNVGDYNMDRHVPQRSRSGIERQIESTQRRSAMMPHDWGQSDEGDGLGLLKPKKKVEKHFDEDLFNV